jgi:hypothetical protein
MDTKTNHVFLTRFNVPTAGYESLIRASDGWLEKRIALFEDYCLPSVRNQDNRNFGWIIYFDPESPQWLMNRIAAANFDQIFKIIFRSEVSRQDLLDDISTLVKRRGTHLLTTNLDNDDSLASDFSQRISAVPQLTRSTALYFDNGLIRAGEALYSRKDPSNAFCSVVSPWSAPDTCWADWHNRLAHSMPVINLAGPPAWLQVVHGSNVSNRVHGHQVSPRAFREIFPGVLDGMPEPSRYCLVGDALVRAPVRVVRDYARKGMKQLIANVAGPGGTDRLKAWVLGNSPKQGKQEKGKGVQNGYL